MAGKLLKKIFPGKRPTPANTSHDFGLRTYHGSQKDEYLDNIDSHKALFKSVNVKCYPYMFCIERWISKEKKEEILKKGHIQVPLINLVMFYRGDRVINRFTEDDIDQSINQNAAEVPKTVTSTSNDSFICADKKLILKMRYIKDECDVNPLHIAVLQDYVRGAKFILNNNPEKIDWMTGNDLQFTPLMLCSYVGNFSMLKLLLQHCNSETLNMRNCSGETALHCVCRQGWARGLKVLLQSGIDPDIKDEFLQTAIFDAIVTYLTVEPHDISLIQSLLATNANLDAKETDAFTPLHIAVDFGNSDFRSAEVISRLLACGADQFQRNSFSQTPLRLAAPIKRVVSSHRLMCYRKPSQLRIAYLGLDRDHHYYPYYLGLKIILHANGERQIQNADASAKSNPTSPPKNKRKHRLRFPFLTVAGQISGIRKQGVEHIPQDESSSVVVNSSDIETINSDFVEDDDREILNCDLDTGFKLLNGILYANGHHISSDVIKTFCQSVNSVKLLLNMMSIEKEVSCDKIVSLITNHKCYAPSLMELCRLAIRENLTSLSDKALHSVPLLKSLSHYITMASIEEDISRFTTSYVIPDT